MGKKSKLENLIKDIKVIDLFCGVGGLTHGMIQEGFNVVAGFDIDSSCKFAYEVNNNSKFYDKDVGLIDREEINNIFGNTATKILVGCAPCQPFSKYTLKQKKMINGDSCISLQILSNTLLQI
nr:DNA cytosine methyltransferase [Helicobacter sp. 11S02596-1]